MQNFTDEQISQIIADLTGGASVAVLADLHKVEYRAIWYWKKYRGLDVHWAKYVRDLEHANRVMARRLSRTERCLHVASQVIRQFERSPRQRALLATGLRVAYGLTRIAVNRIMGITYSAGSMKRARANSLPLVRAMKEYLAENPGQGFPAMFGVLLRGRPGTRLHALKLYRQHALQIQFRTPRPLPRRVGRPMEVQGQADEVWSMDFMIGALPTGERFMVLNGLDDYNREAMFTTVIAHSSTKAVLETLAKALGRGRRPKVLRTDNGAEFKSKAYLEWTARQGIAPRYIRPGKCRENAFIESFNASVRREVLNSFKFGTVDEVQRMLDDWRIRYNTGRPHKGLGGLSPIQFALAAELARGK